REQPESNGSHSRPTTSGSTRWCSRQMERHWFQGVRTHVSGSGMWLRCSGGSSVLLLNPHAEGCFRLADRPSMCHRRSAVTVLLQSNPPQPVELQVNPEDKPHRHQKSNLNQ